MKAIENSATKLVPVDRPVATSHRHRSAAPCPARPPIRAVGEAREIDLMRAVTRR